MNQCEIMVLVCSDIRIKAVLRGLLRCTTERENQLGKNKHRDPSVCYRVGCHHSFAIDSPIDSRKLIKQVDLDIEAPVLLS